MRKKKILIIILSVTLVLFLLAAFIVGSIVAEFNRSGEGTEETVTIEIKQGEGTSEIAGKLKEAGLIKYKIAFYLKVKDMGVGGKLRFGTFTIHKGAGLEQIIETLIHGGAQKEERMFTVPEGYTIEMIAKKLEEESICPESEFLQAVEQDYDYWFLESIPDTEDVRYKLQGFLFPETYAIGDSMTASDIVKVMLEQFNSKFTKEMKQQMEDQGKSIYEIVIEASIIERETKIDSERTTVAGVIKNRLEKGMRLEMCPTVLYPITKGMYDKTTVTNKDTEFESPYNTYENKGLPVGPIASPGLASLEAALHPEEHNYLFYHTDNSKKDGSHIFTETYKEHTNTQ